MKTIQIFNDFTCWLVWNERMLAHWIQVSDRCPWLLVLGNLCATTTPGNHGQTWPSAVSRERKKAIAFYVSPVLSNIVIISLGEARSGRCGGCLLNVFINEPPHDKTNKMVCAPCENSDQPGHLPSLIRVFAIRMKKHWVLSYPSSLLRTLIRLGGCPGWSESSLGVHTILLVLSWGGSNFVVSLLSAFPIDTVARLQSWVLILALLCHFFLWVFIFFFCEISGK